MLLLRNRFLKRGCPLYMSLKNEVIRWDESGTLCIMLDQRPAFAPEKGIRFACAVFFVLFWIPPPESPQRYFPHFLYSYSALEFSPLSHGSPKKPVSSAAHSRAVHATPPPNNPSSSSAKGSLHGTVAGFQPKITECEFIPGSANSLFLATLLF